METNDKEEVVPVENEEKPKTKTEPKTKPKKTGTSKSTAGKKKTADNGVRVEFKTSIEDYAQTVDVSIGIINAIKKALGAELSLTAAEWKRIIRTFRRKPEGVDFKEMLKQEGVEIDGVL